MEWVVLGLIYLGLGEASDELAYDDNLCSQLERKFAEKTGKIVSGTVLFVLLMQKRKRGLLRQITSPTKQEFGDIKEVAAKLAKQRRQNPA
jgi:hypothetical protein